MNSKSSPEASQSTDAGGQQGIGELPGTIVPVPLKPWQQSEYSPWRFAITGLWLGALAGCTSLIVNAIGSVLWPAVTGQPQHPLRLIQVFLTFPFGESALEFNSGVLLALGCLLYIATGMFYGMVFELALSVFAPRAGIGARLLGSGILALLVWIVNFYAVLIWLQPLLLGGRWIVELVPWWVAAGTHLVFGWTMALLYPLGENAAGRNVPPAELSSELSSRQRDVGRPG